MVGFALPARPCRVGGDDIVHRFFDSAGVGDLLHPRLSTSSFGSPPSFQTISNRSLAILPEMVPSDQVDHAAELGGRDRRFFNGFAGLVQRAKQIVDDPVRRKLAVAALGHQLEVIRDRLFGNEHRRIIGRKAEFLDEPGLLVVRQLRQMPGQLIDIGLIELERQQVGIGK
jgi:hypothetical protein